ncbi:hypothetical protein FDJ33_gp78 [Gordonia phage Brandonk123]|uniref:Uncharacterized protein n=1 Tax=Gordonia phage Brandonk123 TaxID=2079564 RepID=A0A2L0HKA0_9CAUD|nr:hypothetical protein FDJ33_gp78 [Gordonia phage Brandonk123]AUX81914.1 hypothetical protein SEA_BRANDONK123_78 [Gordonia phage Brandonk123]
MASDDIRNYDPDTGMLYRWEMPDSPRGFVVEIENDDDGPILCGCVTGPGFTKPAGFLYPAEARWLAENMPSMLASIEAYELQQGATS